MTRLFVTGIGTGVGKTLVSAVLVEALGASYWKPIQAGDLDRGDLDVVRALVSNPQARFLPPRWQLTHPMSPHAAARRDDVHIDLDSLLPPDCAGPLVIEGAGGALVPINDDQLLIDAAPAFNARLVVVSRNYLGSINHTLLTIEALRARNLEIAGIVFNGPPTPDTESFILDSTGLHCLLRMEQAEVDPMWIQRLADRIELP